MKDVNLFIAEPGNTKAILAISALARAMKEMNKVAIIRCVWRQGQANVVVGVLTPNVSEKDNVVSNCKQTCNQACLIVCDLDLLLIFSYFLNLVARFILFQRTSFCGGCEGVPISIFQQSPFINAAK